MKVVSAVLVLGLVASSRATYCTDICLGTCEGVDGIINLLYPSVAGTVATEIKACSTACNKLCKCTDDCSTNCDPTYDTCVATAQAKFNPLGVFTCQFQHLTCIGPCFTQCGANVGDFIIKNLESFLNKLLEGISGVVSQIVLAAPNAAPVPSAAVLA
ncbi:hypothetical protein PoB_000305900 [Plakobranchus ocellatus]|uniref:Secreted protein n=1 Tax=Plakobranchus ocellatus TaxID=259542 RepID=A0AAV3Y3A7_9GAST|nr:hypothetical protein PoB_000305900 [Plakobranchus ocellatus]